MLNTIAQAAFNWVKNIDEKDSADNLFFAASKGLLRYSLDPLQKLSKTVKNGKKKLKKEKLQSLVRILYKFYQFILASYQHNLKC